VNQLGQEWEFICEATGEGEWQNPNHSYILNLETIIHYFSSKTLPGFNNQLISISFVEDALNRKSLTADPSFASKPS